MFSLCAVQRSSTGKLLFKKTPSQSPNIVYETVPCLHTVGRTIFFLSLASSASDCVSFPSTLVAPDHVCELLIGGIEAVVAHHAPQLPHRDLAVVVGVEQRERLLEAVQLLRSQFEFSCCIRSVCTENTSVNALNKIQVFIRRVSLRLFEEAQQRRLSYNYRSLSESIVVIST